MGTAEATCQALQGGPQGNLSPAVWISPGSAPPPHWCCCSPKGSVCPLREGKGLVGEGAAPEGGGLVEARGTEQAELRARVCRLLEAVPKEGKGKPPKPASTWPPKTSPYASQPLCHPAHAALHGARAVQPHSLCLPCGLTIPPASCAGPAVPGVLLPLQTSLSAGLGGQPPAMGVCWPLLQSFKS